MTRIRSLAAYVGIGLFGTNAVPHFVKGITGQTHMSPFGSESSPVVNTLWGSANAAVAGALLWRHRGDLEPATVLAAFVAGVALAVNLAWFWGGEEDAELPWE